ncbi:MAG: 2-oxoglutarate ferredoxin oxidoreductase, gamma subunit [candidate division TA06 bacterium 32_111]|jgi:2-oxoglutarate ferredoxin oxidoreductase subunit gamma|nr:MAG: 2-oxoglutarate ferredoxin oxidoreductase, gamma subunit [candidate division TA06 bacterium 32_111]
MSEIGVRLSGIGGQGVVLASIILGRAASVYDNLYAVQTQTYGSDMRGGDVCTEIIVSEKEIVYPIVNTPDILIAIAQKAFDQHITDLKEGGILITDKDLVNVGNLTKNVNHYSEEFNKKAIDDFNEKRVSNMIMLGFVVEKTKLITYEALEKAIADLLSPRIFDLNKKAIDFGMKLASTN